MAPQDDVNPYEPPSASEQPQPEPEPSSMEDLSVSALPGQVWENTKVVWNRSWATGIVGFVAAIQFLNAFVSNLPNLMMGRTSINPLDPNANSGNPEIFTQLGDDFLLIFAAIAFVLAIGQLLVVALVRPMRRLYFDGTESIGGLGDAFSMSLSRIPTLIAVGILWFLISGVGLLACILPGIVLMLLAWFPSYVAVSTELGVFDSLTGGWELAKRQWKGYGLLFLILIGVFGALSCPLSALQMVPGIGIFLNMLANVAMGTFAIIFYGTLMITLEERDRLQFGAAAWETPNVRSENVGPTSGGSTSDVESTPGTSSESTDGQPSKGGDDPYQSEW